MVLSMNTLSKYDIADIVSHISGEMQPADAQSSEGNSFADLLKEAIKSIPESNVEVNVAESGKTVPQSPLIEKEIKSQLASEGFSEIELQDLFRQALLGDSQNPVRGVSADAREIDRSKVEFQGNSDLLANLRSALNMKSSETAEKTTLVSSGTTVSLKIPTVGLDFTQIPLIKLCALTPPYSSITANIMS